MFDAGTIMARVDIDTSEARRELDELKHEADDASRDRKTRLGAEFDNSDISRARQAFANLDNMISRDAANRLRSSPQGSVLGALNSLFSPHPVTGAPSASMSAQQGLLGRMAGGQAAGAAAPGGSSVTGPAPRDYPQQQAQIASDERQQTALLKQIADDSRQQADASRRGGGLLSAVLGHGGGGGAGAGLLGFLGGHFHGSGGGAAAGLAGGIGPSILGMGLKTTGIVGAGGALLGSLPALLGPLAGLGVGGLGVGAVAGGVALLAKTDKALKDQMKDTMKSVEDIVAQSAGPILKPLDQALSQLPGVMRQIEPLLRQMFAGAATLIRPVMDSLVPLAKTILPGLGQAFRAAAPLMEPLIVGLGRLVGGILPGLTAIIRASQPVIGVFAGILAHLGHDIGGLFAAMAPAVRDSMPIFKALMDVLGAIFPVVGKLAAEFARVLGPVFTSLAMTIEQLLPILKPVGQLLAQLAAAILGDLGSAFQAVLILIRDMEPSIKILAGALGQMFTVLENSGVFAMMGDALEKIAPVLAQLVNQLVRGFAPILPPLISLMSKFSGIMVGLMAAGLTVVLKGITDLLTNFPVLSKLLLVAAAAWGVLTLAMNVNPVVAIGSAIVALIGVIYELVTHWHEVWTDIRNWADDAWHFLDNLFHNDITQAILGIWTLGLVPLATHWQEIWGSIRQWTMDAWNFLQDNIWHPLENLFESTLPGWLSDAYHSWVSVFIDPWKTALQDGWNWIVNNIWDPVKNFLQNTLPGWWSDAVTAIQKAWTAVEDAVKAPINFVIRYILDDGLIKAFNWISSKVGGPSIKPIPTLRSGGTIPGWGGGDSVLAALEPGETVVPKEHSKGLAWLWRALGIPGYQQGGGVRPGGPGALHTGIPQSHISGAPDVWSVFKKIYDAGRIIAAISTGNNTALDNAFYALVGHGVGGAIGDMASLLLDIPKTLIHDAVSWLIGQFGGKVGAGGGPGFLHTGVGIPGTAGRSITTIVSEVLRLSGSPAGWLGMLSWLVDHESGGYARAYNASGASGYWQMKPGTYAEYSGGMPASDIWNPVIEGLAALRYIKANYGTPARIPGLGTDAYQGYDYGGWLPPGGTLAWNQTRSREAVLTPAQSEAFVAVGEMARLFARGNGNIGTGSLMRDVYLTLPEGTTVSQALSEVAFRLRTAQMNGYAGVIPGG